MTNLSSDFELPLAVPENIHLLTSLPTLSSIICLMFCQFCYRKLQSDFIPILKILSEIAYYFLVSCSFASILLWITDYDYLKNSYIEWNYTYHLIGNSYTGPLMSFLPASVALSHVVSDLWIVTFTSCKWQEKSRTHNPILFHLIWFHKSLWLTQMITTVGRCPSIQRSTNTSTFIFSVKLYRQKSLIKCTLSAPSRSSHSSQKGWVFISMLPDISFSDGKLCH